MDSPNHFHLSTDYKEAMLGVFVMRKGDAEPFLQGTGNVITVQTEQKADQGPIC